MSRAIPARRPATRGPRADGIRHRAAGREPAREPRRADLGDILGD